MLVEVERAARLRPAERYATDPAERDVYVTRCGLDDAGVAWVGSGSGWPEGWARWPIVDLGPDPGRVGLSRPEEVG